MITNESKLKKIKIKKFFYYLGIILLTIIITFCFIYLLKPKDDVSHFTSTIDGKNYIIRDKGSHETKQQVADYLSNISTKVDLLVDYMKRHSLPDQEVANRLYNRWRRCHLRETSSSEDSAAYTVNKGEEMRICIRKNNNLRHDNNSPLENPNTAMFVILHELSHVASVSYGHGEEFSENFSYIVHLASNLGIYKPENFTNTPIEYCGTVINTTPCSHGTCSFSNLDIEQFRN